jgi:hypothetical protein
MPREKKSDNLIATLLAIIRVGLLLIGILGLTLSIFRDDGWLSQFLGKIFSSSMGLASIPLIILAVYLINRWITPPTGKASSRGDLPLYIVMAIGAYYLFRLMTTGGF